MEYGNSIYQCYETAIINMIIKVDKVIPINGNPNFKHIRFEYKKDKWICLYTKNLIYGNDPVNWSIYNIIRCSDTEKYVQIAKEKFRISKIVRVDLDDRFIHIDILEDNTIRIIYSNFLDTFKEIDGFDMGIIQMGT